MMGAAGHWVGRIHPAVREELVDVWGLYFTELKKYRPDYQLNYQPEWKVLQNIRIPTPCADVIWIDANLLS